MMEIAPNVRAAMTKSHARLGVWLAYKALKEPYDLFVLSLLGWNPGELVLDNGTGNGRFASELASKGCEVVALDINPILIKAARQNTIENGNVHAILADMTNLPFSHHCFDKIICVHNLWYVPDYRRAIYEMRRVLRSGGILVADHLNLFDPAVYRQAAFYAVLVLVLAKKRTGDIGRTLKTLLRPFQGRKFQVWSVITYDPLQIVKGSRHFARRFVFRCIVE
jgi:SAM-dependent methyltransferase